jgi:hypothetical protein
MRTDRPRLLAAALVAAALTTACAADTSPPTTSDDAVASDAEAEIEQDDPADEPGQDEPGQSEQRFPDVIDAELEPAGDTWRLSATLSSPYDTPERYADAFRAVSEDGTVLGVRELAHDHADEQPFTRSLTGLEIPDEVERITVEGRDLAHGWGGDAVELEVPSRAQADD